METIDRVIYINLDHRTDRKEAIEGVLDALGVPAEKRIRFPAIRLQWPWIGCTRSHHEVVKMAAAAGWSRVWILEDDWMPTVTPDQFWTAMDPLCRSAAGSWDVLLPSSAVQASEPSVLPGVRRGLNIQTASSYIVNGHYMSDLCRNLGEAVAAAMSGGNHWDCINDQYWKRLQPTGTWLYFSPPLGRQRPGHSDLTGKNEDYGV
jgi:hypothetical protein